MHTNVQGISGRRRVTLRAAIRPRPSISSCLGPFVARQLRSWPVKIEQRLGNETGQ